MKSHQLINQDSGNFEYYTPQFIIEAARRTMGWIDLDPASSVIANQRVKASTFYALELGVDGLSKEWFGRVWLNHPFSREGNAKWIEKLISEFRNFEVDAFCCITFAATSEKWFRPLMDFPQCFLSPRTNYELPDGSIKRGVTKGSVVTYGGQNVDVFRKNFEGIGAIKI